jgi:hypothetical protein
METQEFLTNPQFWLPMVNTRKKYNAGDTLRGKGDCIHITFITTYCYNSPIFSYVVNLFLCLAYELNFTIGIVCIKVRYYPPFQTSPEGLRTFPLWAK